MQANASLGPFARSRRRQEREGRCSFAINVERAPQQNQREQAKPPCSRPALRQNLRNGVQATAFGAERPFGENSDAVRACYQPDNLGLSCFATYSTKARVGTQIVTLFGRNGGLSMSALRGDADKSTLIYRDARTSP
jgi:hypothetical protein